MSALILCLWLFKTTCFFSVFAVTVAAISYQTRMFTRRIDAVRGTSLLILFGGSFAFCAVTAAVYVTLLPWQWTMVAVCVAGCFAIACKTPLSTD